MPERMKLTITQVKDPRQVGQAEVLPFMDTVPDNKTLQYGAWNKELYPFIKKRVIIDVDIESKVSVKMDPDGKPYVSRNIIQLYADGEPIIKKQAAGRSYGRSPEERLSIEAQVAVKAITYLEIAGKSVKPELLQLRDSWIRKVLSASTNLKTNS